MSHIPQKEFDALVDDLFELDEVNPYVLESDEDDDEGEDLRIAGGSGSGNFGHAGRPGEIGGSLSQGAADRGGGGGSPPKASAKQRAVLNDVKRELEQNAGHGRHMYGSGLKFQDVEEVEGGVQLSVRYFGDWMVPPDEEDDGDYDWKIPTPATVKKLDTIVAKIQARHPDLEVKWYNEGEKNWIGIQVLTPGASGHFKERELGGPGSGNFGHAGRPGAVGGSTSDSSGGPSIEGSPEGQVAVRSALSKIPAKLVAESGVKEIHAYDTVEEASAKVDEYLMKHYGMTQESQARALVDRERGVIISTTNEQELHSQFAHTLEKRIMDPDWQEAATLIGRDPETSMTNAFVSAFTSETAQSLEDMSNPISGILALPPIQSVLQKWGWA